MCHQISMRVPEQVRVGRDRLGALEPRGERLLDVLGLVAEVEHERVGLLRLDPVEPGEGLHGVEAAEHLVDVHGVQQWLVEPSLELLCDDQHLVVVGVELLRGLRVRERIHARLSEGVAGVEDLAGERHQRRHIAVFVLGDVLVDRLLVTHRMQSR